MVQSKTLDDRLESSEIAALIRVWRAWYGALANVASRPSRKRTLELIYARNHAELMREVARLVDSSDERLATICRDVEVVAAPWMSIDSFADARIEIRRDLVRRCAEIDARLGAGSAVPWPHTRRLAGAAVLTVCALAGASAVLDGDGFGRLAAGVRTWIFQWAAMVEATSVSQRIMIASLTMFLFGWWVLHSMKRS